MFLSRICPHGKHVSACPVGWATTQHSWAVLLGPLTVDSLALAALWLLLRPILVGTGTEIPGVTSFDIETIASWPPHL